MMKMIYKTLSIKSLTDAHVNYIKEKYPKRYEKAMRFRFEDDFLRCIGAYVLLIDMIGDFNEEDVKYTPDGKPHIDGKPHYNISHSGDYILIAVSDQEIGVDIEFIKCNNIRLAPKVYLEDEIKWMEEEAINVRFHYLWCQKESVMKLTGQGIKIPFFSLNVLPFEKEEPINFNGELIENKTFIYDNDYVISISQKVRK